LKVQNKVIVVTGGGNGIGRELVLQLLDKGASVAAVDINDAALKETSALAGTNQVRLSNHWVNVTDRAIVDTLPDQVIVRHGAVDGIINNAGIIQPFVRIHDLAYDAIERVMKVNFYGTLYMVKAFLPHLLKRPKAHIANLSSIGGFLPVPGQTVYGASKAAVKLLTEGLYSELMNTNVRVTLIYAGAVRTNITINSGLSVAPQSEGSSSFRMLSAHEAARQIIAAIEQDRYNALVGSDARLIDLLYRFNPKWATELIYEKMKSLLPS
jgi:short-subunit dehydrogenase